MSFDLRRALLAELEDRRSKNPSYSLRSFARDIGMDASHLSGFLRGRRRISAHTAERIFLRLKIEDAEELRRWTEWVTADLLRKKTQ